VFSSHNEKKALEWKNSEQVLVHDDNEMIEFIKDLKLRR
jgi:hypothetical protein